MKFWEHNVNYSTTHHAQSLSKNAKRSNDITHAFLTLKACEQITSTRKNESVCVRSLVISQRHAGRVKTGSWCPCSFSVLFRFVSNYRKAIKSSHKSLTNNRPTFRVQQGATIMLTMWIGIKALTPCPPFIYPFGESSRLSAPLLNLHVSDHWPFLSPKNISRCWGPTTIIPLQVTMLTPKLCYRNCSTVI